MFALLRRTHDTTGLHVAKWLESSRALIVVSLDGGTMFFWLVTGACLLHLLSPCCSIRTQIKSNRMLTPLPRCMMSLWSNVLARCSACLVN